jgi:hypothetical protein
VYLTNTERYEIRVSLERALKNMLRDIEGCRTWVIDTTLVNIDAALTTDIYRLFMPYPVSDDENYKTVYLDLTKTFDKLQTDFSSTLEKTLKLWKK